MTRLKLIYTFLLTCLLLSVQVPVVGQSPGKKKDSKPQLSSNSEELMIDAMRLLMKGEAPQALIEIEKLLQIKPEASAAHYVHAKILKELKKNELATSAAQKAFDLSPSTTTYGVLLAELYTEQKMYQEAATIYEQLLVLEPRNVSFGIELGSAYIFTKEYDKAIQAYDKLEKVMGVTPEITRQKQQLYLRQNQLQKAIEESTKLIASDPSDARHYVELAELLIANQRIEESIPHLEKAIKLNPDEAQAHVLLADIYRKQGNIERSVKELTSVFANPNLDAAPKVGVLAGYISMGTSEQDKQDALTLAKLVVDTHPEEARAVVIYADLLARQGEKEKARDLYAKAASLDPSVYEIWAAVLQLDGELNQIDSLLVHSDKALEIFPNQSMLWYSNGMANLIKKNYTKAIQAFEECIALAGNMPDLIRAVNAQLGDAYNGKGDHQKSDNYYEKVLKEDPENDHVLNNYSYFLSLRKEQLDKALSMSTKLVQKHQNNATYLDTHAWVLYVRKEYAEARRYLELALKESENVSGTILEHYGDVLYQLGQKDKALEQWKKAKNVGEASDKIDLKIQTGKLHE